MAQPLLHPYVRISTPDQRRGGGLERQTSNNLEEFARRFGFATSERIWIDDGVSAWCGLNATPNHELGRFIAEANRGTIRPGDCLLVENLDRLSRQDIWAATSLVNDLRQLKIHIGRLDQMKLLRYDSNDLGDFLESAVEFGRGNSESEAKSDRNGKAWARKRKAARESGAVMTNRLPAWVEVHDGKMVLIPERAAAIKYIFQLTTGGLGLVRILRRLNEEKVPPFGQKVVRPKRKRGAFAGHWTLPYLARLLSDKRVIGEYQPCGKGRKPEGAPIKDYYPAAIDADLFHTAQEARQKREWKKDKDGNTATDKRGRRIPQGLRQGKYTNLFSGLLRNARTGNTYVPASKGTRVLVDYGSQEGRSPSYSFPLGVFEAAVRKYLSEVKAKDVLGTNGHVDEAQALGGELRMVENDLEAMRKFTDEQSKAGKPWSPTIGQQIVDLEARQANLAARLAEASHRAKHPLSEALGEVQAMPDVLSEEQRLRYNTTLRRLVDSVWLLVVPREGGRDRLCACQFFFKNGAARSFLVLYRAAGNRRPGTWQVGSWTDAPLREAGLPALFDLRHTDAELGATLSDSDPANWTMGWDCIEGWLRLTPIEDIEARAFGSCPRHPLP